MELLCSRKSGRYATIARTAVLFLLYVTIVTAQECPADWVEQTFASVRYCYTLKQTNRNFDAARTDCIENSAQLLWIDSATENTFIHNQFSNSSDNFWIGLNDQASEGNFVWADGTSPSFDDPLVTTNNVNSRDCVVFSNGQWNIIDGYCSNTQHHYVCKSSDNGVTEAVSGTQAAGLESGVIVVIVIVILLVVLVIVVIVVLIILWKYCNDTFNTYVCPCFDRKTKHKVHVLEQENQKLRQELAQLKLNKAGRMPNSMSRDSFDVGGAIGSSPSSPLSSPRPSVLFGQRSPSIVGPNQPPPLQRTLPTVTTPTGPGGFPRQQSLPNVLNRSAGQGQLPRLSLPSPPNAARFTLPTSKVKEPLAEDSEEEEEGRQEQRPADSPA